MIDVEDRGDGVALVQLSHGKVNALDLELLTAITTAMEQAADASAIVLTGAGRAFSAGVDLGRIIDGGEGYVREFLPALSKAFLAVLDSPRPVVAAINGHAIAGGCVLAAACDLRLMADGTIGLAELTVGVPFPSTALEIMRHALGPRAARLVLTGDLLAAPAAQSIGLVDQIEAAEAVLPKALHRASVLVRVPTEVFALTKQQLQEPARRRIQARAIQDDERVLALWGSLTVRDAIGAYLQSLRRRSAAP